MAHLPCERRFARLSYIPYFLTAGQWRQGGYSLVPRLHKGGNAVAQNRPRARSLCGRTSRQVVGGRRHAHAIAPPQLEPAPAVQPKQWLAVLMLCPSQPEKLS